MSKRRPLLLFALLASSLIGGCMDQAPDIEAQEGSASFGLGLDVPAELPSPAPFMEPAEEIQRLEDFIRNQADDILAACGSTHPLDSTMKFLEAEFYLTALDELQTACGQPARDTIWDVAETAIADGTENETYHELRRAAMAARENLTKRLDEHPPPGSAVEAALLGKLASMERLLADSTGTSARWFESYQNGTGRDAFQLRNVYTTLILRPLNVKALLEVMDRYPWRETPCTVPDVDRLEAEVLAMVDKAILLAEELADPSDVDYVSTVYGGLVIGHKPHIEYYAEHDRWPGLLYKKMLIAWDIAYWQNYTTDPVPTQEEAEFLVAQYRNETRSLWTERSVRGVVERVEYYGLPWEASHPATTIKVLALPALQDPYAQLECPTYDPEARE